MEKFNCKELIANFNKSVGSATIKVQVPITTDYLINAQESLACLDAGARYKGYIRQSVVNVNEVYYDEDGNSYEGYIKDVVTYKKK